MADNPFGDVLRTVIRQGAEMLADFAEEAMNTSEKLEKKADVMEEKSKYCPTCGHKREDADE